MCTKMEVDEWLGQIGEASDDNTSNDNTTHEIIQNQPPRQLTQTRQAQAGGIEEDDLENKVIRDIMQATAMLERPISGARGMCE